MIGDNEYQRRFVNCLMNHYQKEFEIHEYSSLKQWKEDTGDGCDLILISDCDEKQRLQDIQKERGITMIYLEDDECEADQILHEKYSKNYEGDIYFVGKYQEVNHIVDEMLKHIGEEISSVKNTGEIPQKAKILGVYSLAENEYQLPMAVTLASILSEEEKTLVIDLQENSGASQILRRDEEMGLEELFVMSESNQFSVARMRSCIGHVGKVDFVYPAENTECFCEVGAASYLKILQTIIQEMEYQVIILNLGSRFQGFFEVLNHCQYIYLLKGKGGLYQWREYEFIEELKNKGYASAYERIQKVELPISSAMVTSYERLIEQWKWNEFGDMIRRNIPMRSGGMQVG